MDGTIRGVTALIGAIITVSGFFAKSVSGVIFGVLILLYVIFSNEYNPERKSKD